MMAAILNSAMLDSATAILDSDTLLSCLRFTQKHSPSTLTLTQTNSFCLKLIHFHLIDYGSHLEFCHHGFRHCNVGIQTPCFLLSDSLKNTLPPLWLWLKLIQSDSNSFILSSILPWWWESAILNSHHSHSHFPPHHLHSFILTQIQTSANELDSDTLFSSLRFTQKHSPSTLTLTQTNSIWLKLIHSHLTWWWQPSWILPSWNQLALWNSDTLFSSLRFTQKHLTLLWLDSN